MGSNAPDTLHLMQTAFKTLESNVASVKEEETPPSKQRKLSGKEERKGIRAHRRGRKRALCEKGSERAKATCGTDEAQFRCEKLRERIKEDILEKKRKADAALEDVDDDEEEEKRSVSGQRKAGSEKE